MKWLVWIVAAVIVADLWVRFAPTPVAKWHVAEIDASSSKRIGYLTNKDFEAAPDAVLAQLDGIALATPRTQVFAGSVDEGRITYVTRSRLWRFPDYTTVIVIDTAEGSRVTLYGRLRFGNGDRGVNRQRIKAWLQALEALQYGGGGASVLHFAPHRVVQAHVAFRHPGLRAAVVDQADNFAQFITRAVRAGAIIIVCAQHVFAIDDLNSFRPFSE